MVVLEAMLQIGRDTVPFLLELWRWWVIPGLVAWVVIVYFVWVFCWRRRGTQILGYAAGAFLVILAVYWEAGRMIASEYEVMGYTSDLFLTICMAILQMAVGVCIVAVVFYALSSLSSSISGGMRRTTKRAERKKKKK